MFNYLGVIAWLFAGFFSLLAAMSSKITALSVPAKALSSIVISKQAALFYPLILIPIAVLFYIDKRLTWDNGLLIGRNRVNVSAFEINKLMGMNVIFLQTATKLWILSTVTAEERSRIKNRAVLQQQMENNETFVKKLAYNLLQSGAVNGQFRLFNKFIVFGLCAAGISFIWALFQLAMMK